LNKKIEESSFSSDYIEDSSPKLIPDKSNEFNNLQINEFDLSGENKNVKNLSKKKNFEIKLHSLDIDDSTDLNNRNENRKIHINIGNNNDMSNDTEIFFIPKNNLINNKNNPIDNDSSNIPIKKEQFLSQNNSRGSDNSFIDEYTGIIII
jgi:hypothetical protein